MAESGQVEVNEDIIQSWKPSNEDKGDTVFH